ncbi:cell division protein ZapA [Thalassomonas viridans]|uniref:Cell division protein ZapA n=1 Tax=Thalassomonas viridans TaxID=137584 RepID=A0AAE9Z319_9GAMM|nr:cell division protein ZapA [Thalassomonas viridans]WDE05876.1 cell division protein ZapA [Thalassomonas viridans]
MPAENSKGISVEIMGKQHQFACPADQEEGLKLAATHLDVMFRDIKEQSGIASNERALLVAALNLSHQLLTANNTLDGYQQRLSNMVAGLQSACNN